jgi:hypothetical protein
MKGALANALRTELTVKDREYLLAYMQTLPEEGRIAETADEG